MKRIIVIAILVLAGCTSDRVDGPPRPTNPDAYNPNARDYFREREDRIAREQLEDRVNELEDDS